MDLSGFLATACLTATMSGLVAVHYGLAALGLFAFATLGQTVVSQFSNSSAKVFVPRINHNGHDRQPVALRALHGQRRCLPECAQSRS